MPIDSNMQKFEVPSYKVHSFFGKKTKYCVCIPIINEGKRIQNQLKEMQPLAREADIIIADGGSTDDSLPDSLLKKLGVRTLLTKTGRGKLSAQMRMAMAFALKEGYRGFIFIDGNNKDDTSAVPRFIKELDDGCDHIQGSLGHWRNQYRISALRALSLIVVRWQH